MKKLKENAAGVENQTTILLKNPVHDEQESVYVIDDEKFGLMSNFESCSQMPDTFGPQEGPYTN